MSDIDLYAIRERVDAYDVMTDAEIIFDEQKYYRRYAAKAHTLARDVPNLLVELDRLRAELARKNADLNLALAKLVKTGAVVEAAKSWRVARAIDSLEMAGHLIAAVDALAAPSNPAADWVDDATMPADETLRWFDALPKVEVVTGPPATYGPLPEAVEGCICSHTVHEGTYRVQLNADADCPMHGEHTLLTAMPADEAAAMGEAEAMAVMANLGYDLEGLVDATCGNRSFYNRPCVLPPHSRRQACQFAYDPEEGDYDLEQPRTLRDFLEAISAGGPIAVNAAMEWCEAKLTSTANDAPYRLLPDIGRIYQNAAAMVTNERDILLRYMESWFEAAASGAGQAGEEVAG